MLRSTDPTHYTPSNGAQYPKGQFGESMKQIAQLLKANLGVEVAFANIGGWDHHVNEGNVEGQLARSLRDFSQGIAAFWQDMGDEAENVTLVSMSEFGRTVRQNGTGGTDHGHANVMFVLGGQVKGGKVYGKWPGLNPEQLYQNRDLAITTDYRQVLAEAVWKNLNARNMNLVFPARRCIRGVFSITCQKCPRRNLGSHRFSGLGPVKRSRTSASQEIQSLVSALVQSLLKRSKDNREQPAFRPAASKCRSVESQPENDLVGVPPEPL